MPNVANQSSPINKMRPIHPGEMLREEFMVDYGIGVAELAEKLGMHSAELRRFVEEETDMTEELAGKLGAHFNTGPTLWLNLQKTYDERKAAGAAEA